MNQHILAVLRGWYPHAMAVLRSWFPQWQAEMRSWTAGEVVLCGVFLVASYLTVRTLVRCGR